MRGNVMTPDEDKVVGWIRTNPTGTNPGGTTFDLPQMTAEQAIELGTALIMVAQQAKKGMFYEVDIEA